MGVDGSLSVESLSRRQELIIEKLSALQVKVANIASKMGITLLDSLTAAASTTTTTSSLTG